MPRWDVEVEGGWRKAEPLSGVVGGPERGLGRAGCVGGVVAALGQQAEGQTSREVEVEVEEVVEVRVLEPGVGRGVDAGVEGAAGGAGAQMLPVWDEAGAGAQALGVENLWGSPEKSGAGLGGL